MMGTGRELLEVLLPAAGVGQICLAFLHIYFASRLNWKEEAGRMSRLNEQIFHVHTFFICLVLVLFGLLSLLFAGELVRGDALGRAVSAGISVFWFCRFIAQIFTYDASHWRGKRLETFVHIGFLVVWCVLTALYAAAAMQNPGRESPGGSAL